MAATGCLVVLYAMVMLGLFFATGTLLVSSSGFLNDVQLSFFALIPSGLGLVFNLTWVRLAVVLLLLPGVWFWARAFVEGIRTSAEGAVAVAGIAIPLLVIGVIVRRAATDRR